jgi:hypothetical protein
LGGRQTLDMASDNRQFLARFLKREREREIYIYIYIIAVLIRSKNQLITCMKKPLNPKSKTPVNSSKLPEY